MALAFSEWIARNSSVASSPPTSRIESPPPGWSSRYEVASYTFLSTTIHTESSELCFSTSAMVKVLPVLASACSFLRTSAFFIHPPSCGPGRVGCSNLSTLAPSLVTWACFLLRKWQLFIIPITFQVISLGWVFMSSPQALREISLQSSIHPIGTSRCQSTQHQCLSYFVGLIFWVNSARCHVLPSSNESSHRMIARPPPL
mmetsp:Transcript_29651/g.95224  ORF Transcript_29651/g.95224 Transcript_29651/m.95224 type:complete len:201 (-) Transcript_29651:256-858(-)